MSQKQGHQQQKKAEKARGVPTFGTSPAHRNNKRPEYMKRYCQTLTLVDDGALIEQYVEAHAHVWPEVIQGQREVGIVQMQIYRSGRYLFMIMDTIDDFDFERDMKRLADLPRQSEWEAYVSQFQGCTASASSAEKWRLIDKIFDSAD